MGIDYYRRRSIGNMSKTEYFSIGVPYGLPDEVYNETCEFVLKETQEYVKFLDIDAHVHYYHAGLITVVFNNDFHDSLDFQIFRTGMFSVCDTFVVVHYVETDRKFNIQPKYATDIDGGPKSIFELIKSKIDKELETNAVIRLTDSEFQYFKHDTDMCANLFTVSSKALKKEVTNMIFGVGEIVPLNIIFNDPATIVYWSDGTKTVVKKQKGDAFKKETGLAMCYVKKFCGNNTSRGLNDILSLAGTRKKPKKKKGAK